MQNNVISIGNTSLYRSLPSSAVFECETASLGPELQVSMGPRPHLWFFVLKAATLAPEFHISMGPVLICGFCLQNKTFGTELQISMGPIPHLWFCACKTA